MAHQAVFRGASTFRHADMFNEASGRAYSFSPEHTLAQFAATGTFNQTFYATDLDQLLKVTAAAAWVSPLFLAKTAVFSRENGFMKDMPAFLTAMLSMKDPQLFAKVFPRTIDNGKMLRNFVQIIRSGAVGRKSLGTVPKRLARAWFASRSPSTIFRQSLGSNPSMKDVIKLVRPLPKTAEGVTEPVRQALYGYLIGKDVSLENLPTLVQAFEAYKASVGDLESDSKQGSEREASEIPALPDVPFEMLTALNLGTKEWTEIAKHMSWSQVRMNLNTLLRHGVFKDVRMVERVASQLRDPELVRRSRVLPYQLLLAFKARNTEMPLAIGLALQEAMEIAIENVPTVEGKVYLCPDVSGSMHSPATGFRKGSTSAARCIDIAALVSAAFLRKNRTAEVIPFSDHVVKLPQSLNPLDSVMTNAQFLAALPSGGTACSAPLRELNARNAKGDLVVYVSDNMSWADFARSQPDYSATTKGVGPGSRPPVMAEEWELFKLRNPNAKLVLIDVQPYGSTQVNDRADVLNVGGFSDSVFEIVALFAKGQLQSNHWVGEINKVNIG